MPRRRRPRPTLKISEAVAEIAERRSVIEEVKGILMFIYRIDDEPAFALLTLALAEPPTPNCARWPSSYRDDFISLDYGEQFCPPRSAFDDASAHRA